MPRDTPPISRYSMKETCLRIQKAAARSRPPLRDKEMAAAAGLTKDKYSRKIRMSRSTFTLEELGLIADFFDAPPGWPVVDADVRRIE